MNGGETHSNDEERKDSAELEQTMVGPSKVTCKFVLETLARIGCELGWLEWLRGCRRAG